MKSILITGGLGYIGSHAAKLFLEKGFKVTIFDNVSRGFEEVYNILKPLGNLQLVKGDLRNLEDLQILFKNYKFDAVLHFAGLCSVHESMENPELYFENNTFGSFNLFEEMRKNGVKKIVFSSTCAVYGETEYLPVDEKHPLNPTNPYGESKLMIEKILRWYGEKHGFNFVVLRYFNVCGADIEGIIGDSKKPSPHLMQNVVRGALDIEDFMFSCPQVKTPDNTPIRDYVDVNDLVQAHFNAYEYLVSNNENQVINLGTGKGNSVKEIVNQVEKILEVEIPKKNGDVRKGEYAAIYADYTKANKVLGWKPSKSLKESILSLRNWYKKYPNGYKH